jgi:DNA-binding beta-propeller fold protein YncE
MRGILKQFIVLTSLSFGLWGCKEHQNDTVDVHIYKGKGVFIVNEGTFTMGNASLNYINLENDSQYAAADVFKQANNRPLGDVFQSMTMVDGKAWLVVNNSGKIEIIDPETCLATNTIKGLKSPRYILEVTPGVLYVSDLYQNAIHIIDAKTHSITGKIPCHGWTETMVLNNGKVWVTNHNSNFIYKINPLSHVIEDSTELAWGGSSVMAGNDGKLWVLCSGEQLKSKTGGLFSINPQTGKVMDKWLFTDPAFNPIKLHETAGGDSLLFIYNGIYKISKSNLSLPAAPFISQPKGASFYGLAIRPVTGELFVADAGDYVSKGKIYIYKPGGQLIKSYVAGITPSDFLFW